MIRQLLLAGIVKVAFLASIGCARAESDPKARELAETFLVHMNKCVPVAGRFRILGISDPAAQEAFRKKSLEDAETQGNGVSFGPDTSELNCRWAWDGSREMLETLTGSNVWRTFFATPEGYLQGTVKGNYNLEAAHASATWRPANYYLVYGARTWSNVFKDCEFQIQGAPAGAPDDRVTLVATSAKLAINLIVSKTKGILHGYRAFYPNGKLLAELTIEKHQESPDGRVFPISARTTIYATTGKADTTWVMNASNVSFPATRVEVDSAFHMVIPEGSMISDFMLSQQIHLKTSTSASDLVAGKLSGTPAEFKTTKPLTGGQSIDASDARYWWGLAILMSLPLAIYLGCRGYRIWKVRDH